MPEADTLAGLAEELRALSARERSSVLAVLSPYERAQVAALIDAASAPAPIQTATPDYSRFSPWLARHLGADPEGAVDRNVTAATRRLLAEAAAELGPAPALPAGKAAPGRRSLADAVGQVLFPRRAVR
jgi:DNA-binding SARP family transcriptional activator